MKPKKEFQSDDLLQMSTEDFINDIETCFDPEVNSEFDPSVIRQVLQGEGAQEFKSFLISTLLSKDNDGTPIKDKLQASTRRTTRQSSVSSSYKTRKKNEVNEFQLYKRKFKLKKCKVILTDIAHSNNRPSKLIKSSPKRRNIPVTVKQEIEINYEAYFNCDICSQKFSNEAKLKDHHKTCQIFKSVAPIPITKVKTEEVNNNSDPDSDFHPENETDTESHGASDSDNSFEEDENLSQEDDDGEEESNSENEQKEPISNKTVLSKLRPPKPGEEIFKCDICPVYCFKKKYLFHHKLTHLRAKYKCEVCSRVWKRRANLHIHQLRRHYKFVVSEKPFPIINCTVKNCPKKCCSNLGLIQHLRLIHNQITKLPPKLKFNCDVNGCQEIFDRKLKLKKHKQASHGIKEQRYLTKKKFTCLNCEITFTDLKKAEEHEETHKIEKPFKCQHCYKRFARKDHCKNHETLHKTGESKFKCDFENCQHIYFNLKRLQEHVRQLHANPSLPQNPPIKAINPCPIEGCDKKLTTLSSLNQHLQSRHPDHLPFTCGEEGCGKKFHLENYLTRHKIRVHDKMTKLRQPQRYPCTFEGCTNTYSSPKNMRMHLAIHRGDFEFKCEFQGCQKKFITKMRLRQHEKIHGTDKPFKCHHCQFVTAHQTSLRLHLMSSHKDGPLLTCPHCSKTFSMNKRLNDHIRVVHTKETPFDCTVENCSRKFHSTDGLRLHLKAHQRHTQRGQKMPGIFRKRKSSPIKKSNKFTRDVSDLETSSDDDTGQVDNFEKGPGSEIQPTKTYSCTFDGCTQQFSQGNELRKHLKSHEPKKGGNITVTIDPPSRKSRRVTKDKEVTWDCIGMPVEVKVEEIEVKVEPVEPVDSTMEDPLNLNLEEMAGLLNFQQVDSTFQTTEEVKEEV